MAEKEKHVVTLKDHMLCADRSYVAREMRHGEDGVVRGRKCPFAGHKQRWRSIPQHECVWLAAETGRYSGPTSIPRSKKDEIWTVASIPVADSK